MSSIDPFHSTGTATDGSAVIEAGTVETDGTVLWRWGINTSGQPYFDTDGCDVGEEAIVTVDDGRFYFEEAPL